MSISGSAPIRSASGLKRQIPSFVLVGLFGYVVDSSVTYLLVSKFGVNPLLARIPAFSIATVLNFALNRTLTFAHSTAPLLEAFVRYVMVCAAGLAVNYAVYVSCLAVGYMLNLGAETALLPLYVAAGSGVAMFVTYFGFRFFAFRV